MTKTLRKSLIIVLTAMLTVFAGLLLISTNTASADIIDTETTDSLACDGFKFDAGASVKAIGFDTEYNKLSFKLTAKNDRYANLLNYNENNPEHYMYAQNLFGVSVGEPFLVPETFKHTFTVCRSNGDGKTATELGEVVIFYNYIKYENSVALEKWVMQKTITPNDELIELDSFKTFDVEYDEDVIEARKPTGANSYKILAAGIVKSGGLKSERIIVKGLSPYSSYFVNFSYEYTLIKKIKVFTSVSFEEETISGTCRSSTRSVFGVLKEAQKAGTLEDMFWIDEPYEKDEVSYNKALYILNNSATQRVKVKYLKQIENTPFAEPVFAYVNVPLTSEGVYIDDVAKELGLNTLNCLGAICQNLVLNEGEGVYCAKYLKNVWIEARTTDERKADYFFDINTSFKDYYYGFVEDEILDVGAYEYLWADMLKQYPVLEKYDDDNVYGLFCMIVVPESYTWFAAFDKLFGNGGTVSYENVQSYYTFSGSIDKEEYNLLLDKYGYTHIENAFSNVIGDLAGYDANYFMFQANPGFGRVQDGDEDIKAPVTEIVDGLEEFKGFGGLSLGCGGGGCLGGDMNIILLVLIGFIIYKAFSKDNKKRK